MAGLGAARPGIWAGVALGLVAALLLSACGGASTPGGFVDIPGLGQTRIDVPRPTNAGAGCTIAIPVDDTLAERAAALRSLGLFEDREDLSDAALAASIEADVVAMWGDVPPEALIAELAVAATDVHRVWWRDLEADVSDGNQVYAATIEEWAAISEGAFAPQSITERWESDTGPVEVSFTLNGTQVALRPEYLEDWIDPRILVPINEAMNASGRQFSLFQSFDQTAVVLALTADERSAFESRGWCFD
jgi:hypothetical protein